MSIESNDSKNSFLSENDPMGISISKVVASDLVQHPPFFSNTASVQHVHEQEMLSGFAIPQPPVSSKESPEVRERGLELRNDAPRTLWMGDLDLLLDEKDVSNLLWQMKRKVVTVKIIKPKIQKQEMHNFGLVHSGYCFIEFETYKDAKDALSLNGQLLPDMALPSQKNFPNNHENQKKYFRLNWASGATLNSPIVQSEEFSLFVGDLSASTTEAHLLSLFQKHFPSSIKTVRVMTDPLSGKSRCFGFVRFTNESDRQQALREMNGIWFGGRPLRVALASSKNSSMKPSFFVQPSVDYNLKKENSLVLQSGNFWPNNFRRNSENFRFQFDEADKGSQATPIREMNTVSSSMKGISPGEKALAEHISTQRFQQSDEKVTTVFVGGLSPTVTEGDLYSVFISCGAIQQIKIPPGKNCGFVKYSTRREAQIAIDSLQGYVIAGSRIRLSWGKTSGQFRKAHLQNNPSVVAANSYGALLNKSQRNDVSTVGCRADLRVEPLLGSVNPTPHSSFQPSAIFPDGGNVSNSHDMFEGASDTLYFMNLHSSASENEESPRSVTDIGDFLQCRSTKNVESYMPLTPIEEKSLVSSIKVLSVSDECVLTHNESSVSQET